MSLAEGLAWLTVWPLVLLLGFGMDLRDGCVFFGLLSVMCGGRVVFLLVWPSKGEGDDLVL